MRIILMGPPGAGKGTQARHISKNFNIPQISTGDILRAEIHKKSKLASRVREFVAKGLLVPDDIVINLAISRLRSQNFRDGFLLDGFPRTLRQSTALLDAKVHIDFVIDLAVGDSLLLERLCGRRIHLRSGRVYHLTYNPPVVEGLDDMTQEPLVQRKDDVREVVEERLRTYRNIHTDLENFYRNLSNSAKCRYYQIDGSLDIAHIHRSIHDILRNCIPIAP